MGTCKFTTISGRTFPDLQSSHSHFFLKLFFAHSGFSLFLTSSSSFWDTADISTCTVVTSTVWISNKHVFLMKGNVKYNHIGITVE
mmetsp:Transcript_11648/g.19190  ORF Transcript_11648/g.19190 Transcript_11648/m.19190 type:complete len:86 (+) Transcript_11648:1150-1407(+)